MLHYLAKKFSIINLVSKNCTKIATTVVFRYEVGELLKTGNVAITSLTIEFNQPQYPNHIYHTAEN